MQPSTQADVRTFVESTNVESVKGVMQKRSGYHPIGTQLKDPMGVVETDPVVALIGYETLAATDFLVVCTTKRQYYYNAGSNIFTDITPRTSALSVTGGDNGTDTVTVSGNHTADYTINTFVNTASISNVTNGGHKCRQNATHTGGTTTIFLEASGVTGGAPSSGTIQAYVEWTGTEAHVVDWVVGVGSYGGTTARYLIITNGIDLPRVWNGTNQFTVFALSAGLSGLVSVGTLDILKDHLVFGNVSTATSQPQTIAWSDTVEFDDFGGGNSGLQLLPYTMGAIRRIAPLGDRLMIYSDESIGGISYVGGSAIFSFEQLIQNTRLLSPRSIANVGPFHLFAAQDNIMLYEGTRMLRPAGDEIHPEYREIVSLPDFSKAHAWNDTVREEVAFVIPTSSTETVTYRAEYDIFNIRDIRWSEHVYGNRPQSFGFFVRDVTLKWNSSVLVGKKWSSQASQWNSSTIRQAYPDRVIGSDGFVYTDDATDYNDGSTAISSTLTTIDFTVPQEHQSIKGRWVEVEMELKGTEVDAYYSLDKGQSYHTLQLAQSLTGNWTVYKFFCDAVSESFRVRLNQESSDETFAVRWIRSWFKAETTR